MRGLFCKKTRVTRGKVRNERSGKKGKGRIGIRVPGPVLYIPEDS